AREPLSYVGINSVGLRRRNFSDEQIKEIHDIYREIYQKGNNKSQAIENIESSMPQTRERDEILDFIRNSKRGVIKGYHSEE
ncbi:MAG: acyl-[acyl-carrier-protein]--UDP-N-acetylglucosamine O-acyltransferase, partial [Bacteroidales bacterium]